MRKVNSAQAEFEKLRYNAHNKPGWNGYDASEYFIQKTDSQPELKYNRLRTPQKLKNLDEKFLDMDYGEMRLYTDLSPLARDKGKAVAFLESITRENIAPFAKAKNMDVYLDSYLNTATAVLNSIKNGQYAFQKNGSSFK